MGKWDSGGPGASIITLKEMEAQTDIEGTANGVRGGYQNDHRRGKGHV